MIRRPFAAFFLLFFSPPLIFAAPAAVPVAFDASAQIGVVAAFKGSVTLEKQGVAGHVAETGEAIHIGDTVSTDATGSLQILLLDETVFTIGPNSAIVIDKFIYDPATQSGKVDAKVVKGVFRFVTGKIARKKPSDMKVALPSGTIGIRGTMVLGQAVGQKSTVVLLGPGARTNTQHRVGQVTVGNQVGGKTEEVVVTRPGFGTTIEGEGQRPAPPFEVPPEQLEQMTSALEPAPPASSGGDSGGEGGPSATSEAGQDTAAGGELAADSSSLGDFFNALGDETENAAQETVEDEQSIEDGVASFNDLAKVQSGKFIYEETAVPLFQNNLNSGKKYDLYFEIDFGGRTVGGGSSRIIADVPSTTTYLLESQPFETGEDPAVFVYTDVPSDSGACSVCTVDAVIALVNEGGIVADSAAHAVVVDNIGTLFEGASQTDSREPV